MTRHQVTSFPVPAVRHRLAVVTATEQRRLAWDLVWAALLTLTVSRREVIPATTVVSALKHRDYIIAL